MINFKNFLIEKSNNQIDCEEKNIQYELFTEAAKDISEGFEKKGLWWFMAFSDIRRRYRRTILGPFWTTLSLSIFLGFASVLFSKLWKMDISNYMPFFASGFISWTFISGIITDGCSIFVMADGLLKQISLPYSTFAWHSVARNLLLLGHHSIVYLIIMIAFTVPVNFTLFLVLPALILICLTGVWVSILLGLMCARYRDLQQVVASLLQISIFVTPIFWPVAQLGTSKKALFILNFNILYHYVSIIRMPLLGQSPNIKSWFIVSGVTLVGAIGTFIVFAYKRKKLGFWL